MSPHTRTDHTQRIQDVVNQQQRAAGEAKVEVKWSYVPFMGCSSGCLIESSFTWVLKSSVK